ncbi:hypothetical protein B0T26DRAFT_679291 [Lasiosphaeria miniovina]|uniref:Uncharacterized protein n=1 Tax=Lasiosphaeria miniovina TaxID=1954250 RepID=A0AA40A664_9PEZI|nr:uncharacterized protein B0T26DRAFT_679291 [Lasiosphaeria miniovina]KAK0709945.1 hypothetical protein B0T26DRAFT_679291 [Lasiosphaeria miniovina]
MRCDNQNYCVNPTTGAFTWQQQYQQQQNVLPFMGMNMMMMMNNMETMPMQTQALRQNPRKTMVTNSAVSSRVLTVPSVILAEAEQQLSLADITAFLAISKPVNQFLHDSAAPSVLEMTIKEALSLAAYTDSPVGTEVSGARLVLSPLKDDAKLIIDGEPLDVTLVSVLFMRTSDDEILCAPKTTKAAEGDPPTLAKVLIGMGYKDHLEGMTIASLMAIVFRDTRRAADLLAFHVHAAFAKAGLENPVPDLYASTATARIGVTCKTGLDRVEIVSRPPPNSSGGARTEWGPVFKLGPVEAQVRDVRIIVTSAGTKAEEVTIRDEALLKMGESSVVMASIEARLPRMSKDEMEIQLTLGAPRYSTTALGGQYCRRVPPDEVFCGCAVARHAVPAPLPPVSGSIVQGSSSSNNNNSSGSSETPLQKLSNLKTEQAGITLRQSSRDLNQYLFKDVFLAANLEGWKEYVPVAPPKTLLAPEIRVMVVDPVS